MTFDHSRRWLAFIFMVLAAVTIISIFAGSRFQSFLTPPAVDLNNDGIFTVEDTWYVTITFLAKIITACIVIITALAVWSVMVGLPQLSAIGTKLAQDNESSQQLLLDLRDGTKHFYKDKRKSFRVKADVTAQLVSNNIRDYIKTIDLSYDGALIRTAHKFKVGDIIELDLFLPLFPKPVHIRVMTVRVVPDETLDQPGTYQVGVKYLEMPKDDRRKLIETLDSLAKTPQQRSSK